MEVLTLNRLLASSTGNEGVILGRNSGLTLGFSSVAGGLWTVDKTPLPDPMRVQLWSTCLTDLNARFFRGVTIRIGMLTGQLSAAVLWLNSKSLPTDGDLFIRNPFPFRTDYGLVIWVPASYTSANYFLQSVVSYE